MHNKIPRRYIEGIVLLEFKSTEMCGNNEKDYLIKRFYAQAQEKDPIAKCFDMVIFGEVEIVDINEEDTDVGTMEFGKEIYRFPFPKDPYVRKQILKQVIEDIKIIMMTTPSDCW